MATEKRKVQRWIVMIAWDDRDREKGDFQTTVRANDATQAEAKARQEMRRFHIKHYREKGETVEDCCAPYTEDGIFGGSLIEATRTITQRVDEIESALRDLVRWGNRAKAQGPEWTKARELLASIIKG